MMHNLSVQELLNKIENQEPFTFSRWGDGEWRSVLGKTHGENCDGHHFFPEMGQELRELLLRRPQYLLGMQPLALRIYGNQIQQFLLDHTLDTLTWHDADVFHKAAIYGRLQPLLNSLNSTRLLVVGPNHLEGLQDAIFPNMEFQSVAARNVYQSWRMVVEELIERVHGRPFTVVSVSASMPAELILDEATRRLGPQHALIDFGSLWDPFVGVKSRRYMQ